MHDSVNFRNGIDGLAGIARRVLQKGADGWDDLRVPHKGRQMLRLLFYDGGGFWAVHAAPLERDVLVLAGR